MKMNQATEHNNQTKMCEVYSVFARHTYNHRTPNNEQRTKAIYREMFFRSAINRLTANRSAVTQFCSS